MLGTFRQHYNILNWTRHVYFFMLHWNNVFACNAVNTTVSFVFFCSLLVAVEKYSLRRLTSSCSSTIRVWLRNTSYEIPSEDSLEIISLSDYLSVMRNVFKKLLSFGILCVQLPRSFDFSRWLYLSKKK